MIRRLTCIAAGLAGLATAASAAPPPKPKLIVVIAVDQFSADLFAQYRSSFTGGLRRLASGVVFGSGYQSHAATETCPGHSTLTSGMHPSGTGMVGNGYWSPALKRTVYCIDDPASPSATGGLARGPGPLKATTLGSWLKDADPRSRTWAVAGKDRAAVPMAGARGDGVFWWNESAGGYTTYVPAGTTAKDRMVPVAAFNAGLLKTWATTPPHWLPRNPKCAVLNGKRRYGSVDFDHRVPPPGWTPPAKGEAFNEDKTFQDWFRASPEFDRVTLELAARFVADQQLGQRGATDLLAIGLSATDYVGHRYGSQGPEMCDQLAWLDTRLELFFKKLDALKLPYVVALTADHGGIDAAERVADRGAAAERIDAATFIKTMSDEIKARYKLDYKVIDGDTNQLVITDFGDPDPVLRAKIAGDIAKALAGNAQLDAFYTRAQVEAVAVPRGKSPERWTQLERIAASYDPERSGDFQLVWKQFASFGIPGVNATYIAGHGSPWDYDRRVPMLFWWPGATGFEQPLAVETIDIAPTLAALAGVKIPPVDGRCLDLDAGAGNSCSGPR